MCSQCHAYDHTMSTCPYFGQHLPSGQEQVSMAYQRLKNDPHAPTYNTGWCIHPNFSWIKRPNAVVPNQYGGLPTNLSQTMPRPNYQGFSNGPGQPIPPVMASNAQSQPPLGYSKFDKYERRIKSDMERMLKENNERILRAIT